MKCKLYTASWCAKCRTIKPFVKDGVEIVDITNWTEQEIATVGLKSVPTFETNDGKLVPLTSVKDLEACGGKK